MDADSTSDEEISALLTKNNKGTSDKLHTADNTVINRITWPHKVLYTCTGEPVVYEELTSIDFVNGSLMVVAGKSESTKPSVLLHLHELVEDAGRGGGGGGGMLVPCCLASASGAGQGHQE